jgi:hypothetical protein
MFRAAKKRNPVSASSLAGFCSSTGGDGGFKVVATLDKISFRHHNTRKRRPPALLAGSGKLEHEIRRWVSRPRVRKCRENDQDATAAAGFRKISAAPGVNNRSKNESASRQPSSRSRYDVTSEPTFSPSATRRIFPGWFILKMIIGRLLSLHRLTAVRSITFNPCFRISM